MAHLRLGELLINAGLINEEQLNETLERQKQTKNRIGQQLLEDHVITEQGLIDALRLQLGIEFVDLSEVNIDGSLARVLPRTIARKYRVVPVKLEMNNLYLAMSDPLNFVAIEEVRKATRKRVVPMISTMSGIDRAIATLYGNEGANQAIEEMKKEISGTQRTSISSGIEKVNAIEEDSISAAPTIRLVNSIIERAAVESASDIHIEPYETEIRVRMRIDGVLRNIMTIPENLQGALVSRLKIMSGMDITERRIPQDGRSGVFVHGKNFDLRMSTLPTIYGEKFVIRLLDKDAGLLHKERLGMMPEDMKKYDYLMSGANGVVLIVGPTGSGKSSTMYTMVRQLNKEKVNLVTLEDPIEYNVKGINQVQINEKVGMTFASGLRSILRQDPDIIAVGEIRDGETAEIAMRAAITGHLVLSTIHTNDALATVDRLVDIGVEPYLISAALNGVISQRLVRRVCPECRKAHLATAEECAAIGLPPGNHTIYKGEGCPACFGTGYRGRIGVFEILLISQKLRGAINRGAKREELEQLLAEENSFVTLAENCRRLVLEGVTTVEEARRVTTVEEYMG